MFSGKCVALGGGGTLGISMQISACWAGGRLSGIISSDGGRTRGALILPASDWPLQRVGRRGHLVLPN